MKMQGYGSACMPRAVLFSNLFHGILVQCRLQMLQSKRSRRGPDFHARQGSKGSSREACRRLVVGDVARICGLATAVRGFDQEAPRMAICAAKLTSEQA